MGGSRECYLMHLGDLEHIHICVYAHVSESHVHLECVYVYMCSPCLYGVHVCMCVCAQVYRSVCTCVAHLSVA